MSISIATLSFISWYFCASIGSFPLCFCLLFLFGGIPYSFPLFLNYVSQFWVFCMCLPLGWWKRKFQAYCSPFYFKWIWCLSSANSDLYSLRFYVYIVKIIPVYAISLLMILLKCYDLSFVLGKINPLSISAMQIFWW